MKGKEARLNWTVINQEELKEYHLIRKTENFGAETIASLLPGSNSYVDTKIPGAGELQYQLKAKNSNGDEFLSNWVTLNFENSDKDWKLFPNPVNSELRIRHSLKGLVEVNVRLLDLSLKELDNNFFRLMEGDLITYNTSFLIPGTYLICIESNGQRQYLKFLKT
ncbi:MAG: T9SS type A sorting domain-containing protein [Saprospiraceae bacterium]|nr:T9SS type A sorting domain-containing protein [Candidatus Vicinibacter affinis]